MVVVEKEEMGFDEDGINVSEMIGKMVSEKNVNVLRGV